MRENLFHGKRKDNGKWVEGYYFCDTDLNQSYIQGYDYYTDENGLQREAFCYEVIPETVGQYIELPDKNGKKIFEGDICKVTLFIFEGEDRHYLCEVCFDCGLFVFRERSDFYILFVDIYDFETDVEVIGNIYDNPELIGGRNER